MPFLTIQIAKGHSIEQKRVLVQALTDTLVTTLGTKPEWVTIHIDEFEWENWAVGNLDQTPKFLETAQQVLYFLAIGK